MHCVVRIIKQKHALRKLKGNVVLRKRNTSNPFQNRERCTKSFNSVAIFTNCESLNNYDKSKKEIYIDNIIIQFYNKNL